MKKKKIDKVLSQIRPVKEAHETELMKLPNVVGVGIGYKVKNGKKTSTLSIQVFVEKKIDPCDLQADAVVPKTVEKVKTDVIEVGKIEALALRTDKWRPAPPGVSIGHYKITAGTLGLIVKKPDGKLYILSNNHVLANSNDANIGDAVYQPGPYDGGTATDTIGALEDFVPISFDNGGSTPCPFLSSAAAVLNFFASILGAKTRVTACKPTTYTGPNEVDAAIAKPWEEADVMKEILEIGTPTGVATATLGMQVKKSGRTTGVTTGVVQSIDATVTVSYGASGTAIFTNQILTTDMSEGGDSGSGVVDNGNRAVALLFAGSDTVTVMNHIGRAFDLLGVSLA